MRPLGRLALVVRAADQRITHVDSLDDQDVILDVDLALRLGGDIDGALLSPSAGPPILDLDTSAAPRGWCHAEICRRDHLCRAQQGCWPWTGRLRTVRRQTPAAQRKSPFAGPPSAFIEHSTVVPFTRSRSKMFQRPPAATGPARLVALERNTNHRPSADSHGAWLAALPWTPELLTDPRVAALTVSAVEAAKRRSTAPPPHADPYAESSRRRFVCLQVELCQGGLLSTQCPLRHAVVTLFDDIEVPVGPEI